MAVKPVVHPISPWDANIGKEIRFTYEGTLPVSCRVTILNASTMKMNYDMRHVPVYSGDSFLIYLEGKSTNPSMEKIDNGDKYCIQVECIDNNGEISPVSDKVYFWCLSEPTFTYITPMQDQMIEQSSLDISLSYNQANGDDLHDYRHYLYDNTRNVIATSDIFYNDMGLDYSFKGIENKTAYYVRSQGTTKRGMSLDTGLVKVYVNYPTVGSFNILDLKSDENATVIGNTNMIVIEPNEQDEDFIYINSCVQLIGKTITYENNFKIPRDFSMQIKLTKTHLDTVICFMKNKANPNCHITIGQYEFDDGVRYSLKAYNGLTTYVLYTDPIICDNDDFIVVNVKRIKNVYSITALLCE